MRQSDVSRTASLISRFQAGALRPLQQLAVAALIVGSVTPHAFAAHHEAKTDEEGLVATLAQQFATGQIGGGILFWNERERRIGFKNLHRIYPTRLLPASASPYPLGSRPRDLGELTYTVDGERFTVADFLEHDSSIGVIVVHSNAPAAVGTPYHAHLDAAIDAIRAAF